MEHTISLQYEEDFQGKQSTAIAKDREAQHLTLFHAAMSSPSDAQVDGAAVFSAGDCKETTRARRPDLKRPHHHPDCLFAT
jgi:hypothetical protein